MYKITIEVDNGDGGIREFKAKNKNEIIEILCTHLINSIGDYVNIDGDCGWDFGKI